MEREKEPMRLKEKRLNKMLSGLNGMPVKEQHMRSVRKLLLMLLLRVRELQSGEHKREKRLRQEK